MTGCSIAKGGRRSPLEYRPWPGRGDFVTPTSRPPGVTNEGTFQTLGFGRQEDHRG